MSTRLVRTLSLAAVAATLAACSSVPLDQSGTGTGTGTGTDPSTGQVLDPFNPQSILARERSVYFEYDSYVVPDQYRRVVEQHGSFLANNRQYRTRIEGHADARGGAEYNLALGQRRSEAVSRMLVLLGASPDQLEAVSFGKERPRAMGHTEADYAENRRADINYQR